MKVAVIGTGYVGLTQAACLAELGNEVIGIDNNSSKIQMLNSGEMPIYENGMKPIVISNMKEGRLKFTTDINEINGSQIIFICVGTPPGSDGKPNLSYVENVANQIGNVLKHYAVIVEKSTVPVRTADWMKLILRNKLKTDFDVAVNPEFLREGTAVDDFFYPDRIVVGTDSPKADAVLSELYKPLNAPILHVSLESAELIKHGSNAFLAMKISYANMFSRLCEKAGADVETVMKGIGLDKRIGESFFRAGIGYGGFCFPKDLDAFVSVLEDHNVDASLLKAVKKLNDSQAEHFVNKIVSVMGSLKDKRIGVLGLAFKAGTDDMRLAPSIPIISKLHSLGANIYAYDPKSMDNAKAIDEFKNINFVSSMCQAVEGCDALAILTEWPEFRDLDFNKVKESTNLIFDGRNMFNINRMRSAGFSYHSIGRK
ncbi:MAG TPA: UDP-glucose/GDP-mannose dehydrogenase family protein [Candidatus Nanoarchaeia archaeon]|nr:UDP-glucose/GDP-mannose dehydrogenase family protein [Candidatus Nanoarchaeia archaeon]